MDREDTSEVDIRIRGGEPNPQREEPTRADPPTAETFVVTGPAGDEATVAMEQPVEAEGGLILGRYRLKKRLGSGAFGTVWSARDERLERDVAVKLLPRERVVQARFEREARAAARLQHPAIVTLYEAAVDDDGAYLVSELVRGRTFDQLLGAGKLSDREIVEIGAALCEALDHAHAEGVIHRDVKPSNVLIATKAGRPTAKLTDFGVAHVAGGDTLTRTGDVIGTLAYMAPEQADGGEVTPASDLYALAVVLYEALTGVNPLAGRRGRRGVIHVPPLRRQRRDLSRTLAAGIDRALQPRPSDRGTGPELRAALLNTVPEADETRGVVVAAGRGSTLIDDRDGDAPRRLWTDRWRDGSGEGTEPPALAFDVPTQRTGRAAGRDSGVSTPRRERPSWNPSWLPRALGAAASGPTAGLLCTHLLHGAPIAPAAAGILVAAAVLLFPRLGVLAATFLGAVITASHGYDGAALALGLVAIVPALLQFFRADGWGLPAGAALLGLIGIAGAWPGLVARVIPGWWQRAVVAAAGFVWASFMSLLLGRNLYWRPHAVVGVHGWSDNPQTLYHQIAQPFIHGGGLYAMAAWAAAAVVLPLLQTRRWPLLDIVLTVVISATTAAVAGDYLHGGIYGAAAGAVAGGLIAVWPSLIGLISAPS
jgi:serine/threonine protein kinase